MPRGDRTGPRGAGPQTGRGAGQCAGDDMPGYANAGPGRGLGMGFRRGGRGWRHVFYATGLPRWARRNAAYAPPPSAAEQELTALKAQARQLGDQLETLIQRIAAIEGEG